MVLFLLFIPSFLTPISIMIIFRMANASFFFFLLLCQLRIALLHLRVHLDLTMVQLVSFIQ